MKTGKCSPAFIIVSLMAVSVPLSLFTTSLSIIFLLFYWCIADVPFHQEHGFFKTLSANSILVLHSIRVKLRLFLKNPAAVGFASLYLLYLAGCLWSSNSHYSLEELREKLPILILPVLFTGIKPFTESEFRKILILFISGVLMGTLAGVYIFFTTHIADTRELSPFMHHIRFSMNICMAIFILFRFLVTWPQLKIITRTFFVLLICWFAAFLFILKSLTGVVLFIAFSLYLLFYFSRQLKTKWLRRVAIAFLVIFPVFVLSFIYGIYNRHFNIEIPKISQLASKTVAGNDYTHDTVNFKVENGQYVGLYLCERELKQNWEKRSRLNYNGRNLQGEELRYTIIRYLNSKGYRKDSVGLSKLTPEEISSIEKGVANAGLIQPFNLAARIEGLFIDYKYYRKTGNANGKSEIQRLEYWKTTLSIIKQNWLTGVGTGDVEDAFTKEYDRSHSKLETHFRGTSHNQYLYMGVAFGVGGIIFFLCWLIIPPLYLRAFRDYYFSSWFTIMILSMLNEDSIRYQAGLYFLAFFSTLFLFGREKCPEQ